MHTIDIFIQNYFSLVRSPDMTEFYFLLSVLFDLTPYFLVMALFVACFVYLVRNIKYAILFIFSLTLGASIVFVLKLLFNVARPVDTVMTVFGKSFPSYHATIASIFFIMLMYIFDDYFKSLGRIIFNSICVFSIFLVAMSRVYLGVHWVSDVLIGVILGATISYISILIFRKGKNGVRSTSMLR